MAKICVEMELGDGLLDGLYIKVGYYSYQQNLDNMNITLWSGFKFYGHLKNACPQKGEDDMHIMLYPMSYERETL